MKCGSIQWKRHGHKGIRKVYRRSRPLETKEVERSLTYLHTERPPGAGREIKSIFHII
jgi:hypothetical protein